MSEHGFEWSFTFHHFSHRRSASQGLHALPFVLFCKICIYHALLLIFTHWFSIVLGSGITIQCRAKCERRKRRGRTGAFAPHRTPATVPPQLAQEKLLSLSLPTPFDQLTIFFGYCGKEQRQEMNRSMIPSFIEFVAPRREDVGVAVRGRPQRHKITRESS